MFVGNGKCNVTQLGTTVLVCAPERPKKLKPDEPFRSVDVSKRKRMLYKISDFLR